MLQLPPSLMAPHGQSRRQTTFKAGRCTFKDGLVTPIDEKGRISLFSDENGLTHFQWKSRQSNQVVDDLIIIPEEAKWVKVPQCTTGRIFLLDYGTDERRYFYWLQDANEEKDDELFERVRKVVCGNSGSSTTTLPTTGLGTPSQSQLFDMIGQAPPPGLVPTSLFQTPTNNNNSTPTQPPPLRPQQQRPSDNLADLSGLFTQDALSAALSSAGAQQPDIDLTEVLKADSVAPLLKEMLKDQQVREKLFPHLPESQAEEADAVELLRAPQFQQTLKMLTAALRHGNAQNMLSSMGLNPEQAGPAGGVQSFLRALQAEADSKKDSAGASSSVKPEAGGEDDDLYGEEEETKPAKPEAKPEEDDEDLYGEEEEDEKKPPVKENNEDDDMDLYGDD